MNRATRWLVIGGLSASGAVLLGRTVHRLGHRLEGYHNDLFVGRGSHIYERWAPRLVGSLYRRVAAEVAANYRTGTLLDVGCGPGTLAFEIAQAAPNLNIIGVDLSADMIHLAQAHAAQANLSNRVRFEVADGADLPFPTASIDLVVSTLSMHHWEQKAAVMKDLVRVVRPGGEIRIYDVWRPALLAALDDLPLRPQMERMPTWIGPLPLPGFTRYLFTRE